MVRSRRKNSQFVSCLFEVEFINGVPYIQNCHLRILGQPNDVRIEGDCAVSDFSLMDCYEVVNDGSI